jgi:hypothetical protein
MYLPKFSRAKDQGETKEEPRMNQRTPKLNSAFSRFLKKLTPILKRLTLFLKPLTYLFFRKKSPQKRFFLHISKKKCIFAPQMSNLIIDIQEKFGAELHTRQMVERLAASLNAADSYLLDMSGVMQISRSAADELYNLTHGDMNVDLINVEPFVEKMLSAVKLGRFLPRQRSTTDTPIIHCETIGNVLQQLSAR